MIWGVPDYEPRRGKLFAQTVVVGVGEPFGEGTPFAATRPGSLSPVQCTLIINYVKVSRY